MYPPFWFSMLKSKTGYAHTTGRFKIINSRKSHCIFWMSTHGLILDLFFYFILIIAYCLLRQSPMSDITYISLIMSNSDYHGNWPPHMLRNLSQEAAAVRVGDIWNGCLLIVTELRVAAGIVPARTSCHCAHCVPHYKSTTLSLLWAPMLPQCVPPILPPCWDSMIGPQMGKGSFWLTRWPRAWSGGLAWHLPGFTRGLAQFACRLM